jgi:hypothetical protein
MSFFRCTEELALSTQTTNTALATTATTSTIAGAVACSDCKYVVPANTYTIDGAQLGIKPGDVIGISGSRTTPLNFVNIVGTADQPIIIRNCGNVQATVAVASNASFAVKFTYSKYFRLTGGTEDGTYGIKISGGTLGVSADLLSTNFEIDHVEVSNTGFAGIMAKTNPSCDSRTWRGNFTMTDAFFHHNYVHDTGGEGFYVGNSFYASGESTSCGTLLPGELKNIKIYNNRVVNSGYESIQLGCAVSGAEIHDNVIENYGTMNVNVQNNGIQIGEGTGGLCYNNHIKNAVGTGAGIILLGLGDNVVFNNIILNSKGYGIFADSRYTPGPGFKIVNNDIINPKLEGVRLYAAGSQYHHYVMNNLIANSGTYATLGSNSYVHLLNSSVVATVTNNWNTQATLLANYLQFGAISTQILVNCPLVDRGASVSAYGVTKDFNNGARPLGLGYDIGAIEYK